MSSYVFRAILTPAKEGGYCVEVPALPGCYTEGDTYREAVCMAEDALKTYVAALVRDGQEVPAYEASEAPDGCLAVDVEFSTDAGYIVDGEVVSAAEASRILGVSAGRVTHMIDSGILDGYRRGRRTYVTRSSVEARLVSEPKPGRPRHESALA